MKVSLPRDADYWQLVPVYCDSTGRKLVSDAAIAHGPVNHCLAHVRDSRAQKADLALINDALHAKETLRAIRDRERAVAIREDSVAADVAALDQGVLQQLLDRIAVLETRLAEIEAQRIQAKLDAMPDADDPASYSPGGELHSLAPSAPASRAQRTAGDQGDLPNEITRKVPLTPGTDPQFDPAELGRGPNPAAPPVAISLNADAD